jgi:hypothetical protein
METVGNRAVSGFYEEQVGVLAEGYSPNACAWTDGDGNVLWTSFDKAPEDGDHFAASYMIDVDNMKVVRCGLGEGFEYAKVSDGEFTITNPESVTETFARDAERDMVFWKVTQ